VAALLGADALREAAQALESNDFAGAIPHLEAALEDDPTNVNARFNLAYARQATGDAASAIKHYQVIAKQQPDLMPARQNLATLLMQADRFADAALHYEAIAEAQPENRQALQLAASAHSQAGQAEQARAAFQRLSDIDGTSLEATLGLASSLAELGRLHEAVPHYLRAIQLDPSAEDALLEIAKRLEESGFKQDALELYRRYARNRPDDAAVQEEIGVLLLESGNLRAATQALERAVQLEPRSHRHAALGEAYRQAGKVEAAREQLSLAAKSAPGDAKVRLRYANALLQQQEYELASREYVASLEVDPGASDAWNGLAFAMYRLGSFPAALRALKEAEKLGPPLAASVYLRALCQDSLQLYEEAQDSYRAFLALSTDMQEETWKATQRLKTIAKVLEKR
jgi:tetratricopeptide (TPR) repeat protein